MGALVWLVIQEQGRKHHGSINVFDYVEACPVIIANRKWRGSRRTLGLTV